MAVEVWQAVEPAGRRAAVNQLAFQAARCINNALPLLNHLAAACGQVGRLRRWGLLR